MKIEDFLSQAQEKQIVEAICQAERNTSGEIRVHIEQKAHENPLLRAEKVFSMLKMHKTRLRNAVLFYVNIKNQNFAIFADEGIYKKVPENFWDNIKQEIENNFKKQNYFQGLTQGISAAGQVLEKYFPATKNDENELPNEISKG